jgi:hypothetical protein
MQKTQSVSIRKAREIIYIYFESHTKYNVQQNAQYFNVRTGVAWHSRRVLNG